MAKRGKKRRIGKGLTPAQVYYLLNRERILAAANARYRDNPAYREAARRRARERYQNDPAYHRITLEAARKRARRRARTMKKLRSLK